MIFLDYASATPMHEKVVAAMTPYFSELFYNPSAPYLPAKSVQSDYRAAKDVIAHAIGAKGNDLIITAGATESINLAFSVLAANTEPTLTVSTQPQTSTPVCLIAATEHDAVYAAASRYSFDTIKVNRQGIVDLVDLERKITDHTMLVSIALVNNELGMIAPLASVAAVIRRIRDFRLSQGNLTPLYLHSDASQALGLLDLNVSRLGIDLLTINAAKIYGPKGVGALYAGRGIKLMPQILGGGQERGLRSGTENVAGAIGFATAVQLAKDHLGTNRGHYQSLRQAFLSALDRAAIKPIILSGQKSTLDNFCSLSFPGLDAERLVFLLEEREIMVSTGAACAASKGRRSRTLESLGLTDSQIAGSLRITFGLPTTIADVKVAAAALVAAVNSEVKRLGL